MCLPITVIFLVSIGSLADVLRCTSFSLTDRVMFWGKMKKREQQSLCDSKKLVREYNNKVKLIFNNNSYSTYNRN